MNWIKNNPIYIILLGYLALATLTIIYFNGTGDSGDSLLHYLYAKSAPGRPDLYFDHWAKPVFVLLASPFAQFGIVGIKVFNVIVSLLTLFITYRVAEKLELKNALLIPILLICSPLAFVLTFSGLTEPLFALVSILGLYYMLKEKFLLGCIIISFLPFVRSEGLLIMSAFGLFLLFKQQWKMIPWLLFGHVAYSIAGLLVKGDFFWVITEIPYSNLGSPYGSGELLHFVDQFTYVIGIPIYILFIVGLITLLWKLIKRQFLPELHTIVLYGFLSFFIAHSLFWYLGIFNSMGLKRVLVGVLPFAVIIALIGFNFITETALKKNKSFRLIVKTLLILYVIIFPFTSNPAAINIDKDLRLSEDEIIAIKVIDYIENNVEGEHRFVYAHPYLSELLNIDHFNDKLHIEFNAGLDYLIKPGDIIIWENWFCVTEAGIPKQTLINDPRLIHLKSFSHSDTKNVEYSIFHFPQVNPL